MYLCCLAIFDKLLFEYAKVGSNNSEYYAQESLRKGRFFCGKKRKTTLVGRYDL